MSRELLVKIILWLALLLTLGGGVGMYRFYLTTPELRFPEAEANWHLVPLGVLLLVIIALLLTATRRDKNTGSNQRTS